VKASYAVREPALHVLEYTSPDAFTLKHPAVVVEIVSVDVAIISCDRIVPPSKYAEPATESLYPFTITLFEPKDRRMTLSFTAKE
jgi:hypothetical protein